MCSRIRLILERCNNLVPFKPLRFLYNKWVLGCCPHICLLCKFRKEMLKYCKSDLSCKLKLNK